MKNKAQIIQSVTEYVQPIVSDLGLNLVLVDYRQAEGGWVLRIFVERLQGLVTVDDCTKISRELSDLLDIDDPIETRYRLEVSSPGLDRPLVTKEDYQRFAGREVKLTTREPIDGRRKFKGVLEGIENDAVRIEVDGSHIEMDWNMIEKANLVPNFR